MSRGKEIGTKNSSILRMGAQFKISIGRCVLFPPKDREKKR